MQPHPSLPNQTDRLLAESFRQLMASNLLGIAFWKSPDFQITAANGEWLRSAGLAAAPPDTSLAEILRDSPPTDGLLREHTHLTPEGDEVPVLAAGARLEDGSGVFFALDISEQKRLEERLRQAAKLESLGILSGGIAHDFNNLLTGILANASLALEAAPPSSRQEEAIRGVIKAAENAAALTQQLLAYSSPGRSRTEHVDLSAVASDILPLIETAVGRHASLTLDLSGELPSVEAQPAQLQQVVMNLVINASEAIDGAGAIRLRTGVAELDGSRHPDDLLPGDAAPPGRYAFLSVSDTGLGMDRATLERIFDPFFTTKFGGRGLGLAALLGIVRAHHGAIRVASSPGLGTTFAVYLPASDQPATWPEPGVSTRRQQGQGMVLIVDDEEYVRETARRTLETAGYIAICATGGPEALEVFHSLSPRIAVAILDYTILDQHDLARRLRHLDPRLRIVATSGYPEAEIRARFGDAIDSFLPKPYRSQRLNEVVRSLMNS